MNQALIYWWLMIAFILSYRFQKAVTEYYTCTICIDYIVALKALLSICSRIFKKLVCRIFGKANLGSRTSGDFWQKFVIILNLETTLNLSSRAQLTDLTSSRWTKSLRHSWNHVIESHWTSLDIWCDYWSHFFFLIFYSMNLNPHCSI